ncbi:hypothetical protein ACHAXA_011398 [Cyclostephanos tholiformis]|uniref:O-methyltransferase domain-containing protein n=1 Tax=Cyclostephanos tholiformis TaxID=382380 RepID=A0ABD3RDV2_9STRA
MSHPWRNGTQVLSIAGDNSDYSDCNDSTDVLLTNNIIEHPQVSQSQAELDVIKLAQSHFTSQALLAAIRVGALDVLAASHDGDMASMSVDEIIAKIQTRDSAAVVNRDALFRCLRLLCTSGVIKETINCAYETAYSLTQMGRLLHQRPGRKGDTSSMASFVLHWSEIPLWNAWSELPDYVAGKCSSPVNHMADDDASRKSFDGDVPPFDRANGISASDYYKKNQASCTHRNAVARYASSKEITSILSAMQSSSALNESKIAEKTVVDVGGGYGCLIHAIKTSMPTVGRCYCLDLPGVIDDAILINDSSNDHKITATFVQGNMFDPSTIPPCDIIITKHVLCDFSDEDVLRALRAFHESLSHGGKLVIMDAVLPNGSDLNSKWNAAISFDVLLMLTGRRGERSRLEWSNLGQRAGFVLEDVLPTSSVTVDLAILSRI